MTEMNGSTPDLVIHRAMRRVVGHVLIDDTRYQVKSPPGTVFAHVQTRGVGTRIEDIWGIVQALVPDLPEDVLRGLTLEHLSDIITYAMNPARAVEARAEAELAKLHPKVETAARMSQSMPLDTSAPASPSPPAEPIGVS